MIENHEIYNEWVFHFYSDLDIEWSLQIEKEMKILVFFSKSYLCFFEIQDSIQNWIAQIATQKNGKTWTETLMK
jgi:hypothetical protein